MAESTAAAYSAHDLSTIITNKVDFRYAPLPDEEEEGGYDGNWNDFDNYEDKFNEFTFAFQSEEAD